MNKFYKSRTERFASWLKQADEVALRRYGITAKEINGGDDIDEYDMTEYLPEHWVEYKAEKYGLISLDRLDYV